MKNNTKALLVEVMLKPLPELLLKTVVYYWASVVSFFLLLGGFAHVMSAIERKKKK